MTVQDFINWLQQLPPGIMPAVFIVPPLLTWIISILKPDDDFEESLWNYLYSFLVYAVCFPGICAAVLTGYSIFFLRQNLLQVNALVYFIPIVSMIVTLMLMSNVTELSRLPGVGRLYGLMALIGVSFIIALAVEKTRIWVVFGGSIISLIAFALVCMALLKWGGRMLFRRRSEPEPHIRYSDISKLYARELDKLKKKMPRR